MNNQWSVVREQFPELEQWAYFNSATMGIVPRCALEAVERHNRRRRDLACTDFVTWYDDADRVRELAAQFIGAAPGDIAFVPNTATALSWLLQGIDWKPGDRVVAIEDEFTNNIYSGHSLARRGVEFVEVPLAGGAFHLDRFYAAVNDRTRLVMMSIVNYSSGLRPPVCAIGEFLRERGIFFYLDATQSLGALQLDMRRQHADVLAAHGYKWMLCPTGIGIAFIHPDARKWLQPAVFSWRSDRHWREVSRLRQGPPDLPEEALRYEGGMQNFPGIYALEAVLKLMLELDPAVIERRVMEVASKAREVLRSNGALLPSGGLSHYDSQIIAAELPGVDAPKLVTRLREQKVVAAARQGRLRISPHFYNSEKDLEKLGEAIARYAK